MGLYLRLYMDKMKKEKLDATARFRRLQYLHSAIKVLFFASVSFCLCRFVLPAHPWESLKTLGHNFNKLGMFFLCNVIFAFLAADSRTVTAQANHESICRETTSMDPSESVGKELVVCVDLEKEEADTKDWSIVKADFGDGSGIADGKQGAAVVTMWDMVLAAPPSEEEKEFTLTGREQKITLWELVPVSSTMAEEAEEEDQLWDVMSDEEVNKKFEDFIAKTRRSWRVESMQLMVV